MCCCPSDSIFRFQALTTSGVTLKSAISLLIQTRILILIALQLIDELSESDALCLPASENGGCGSQPWIAGEPLQGTTHSQLFDPQSHGSAIRDSHEAIVTQ